MATRSGSNGWAESKKFVMSELGRIKNIEEHVIQIRVDIGQLKIKAGMWGALAGMVPTTVALVLWILAKA